MIMRVLLSFTCASVTLLSAALSRADLIDVHAGSHDLLPNTAGQIIEILVSGDGAVQGLNFDVQIGNGRTGYVPAVTNVDIVGPGLLFGGNNNGDNGMGTGAADDFAGFWNATTTTADGTVSPQSPFSVLARVEIDTTAFFAGSSFELILNNGIDVLTDFTEWGSVPGEDLNIYNGTVNIVPEPSSLLLLLLGGVGLALLRLRAKR